MENIQQLKTQELIKKIVELEIKKFESKNDLEYETKRRNEKTEFLKNVEIVTQPTKEDPIIIDNYPYGFRLRTQIKYYVETNNRGQRFISQTLNPKTNQWNKEKWGNYSPILIVYKELSTGHISRYSLDYSSYLYTIEPLLNSCLSILSDEQIKQLKLILRVMWMNCYLTVTIGQAQKETPESIKADEDNKREIQKLYNYLAHEVDQTI